MKNFFSILTFLALLFCQALWQNIFSADLKRPLLSLGIYGVGGYALNLPFHQTYEPLAKWGRLTQNPQSASKPAHYLGGGGANIRHYFTWLKKWAPAFRDIGLELGASWVLFENAQTGYLTAGDATLTNDISIKDHSAILLESNILWRVYSSESFAFDFVFGFLYTMENFKVTEREQGVFIAEEKIKATGIGGLLGFHFEHKLTNWMHLFWRVNLQFLPVTQFSKNQFGKKTITDLGQSTEIYSLNAQDTKSIWDQHAAKLIVGVSFYAF
ncbi:MAG: hypothetical protein D6767_05460 [Candidatus Hydrogenedentota bacterium]|nr:MAG: hypothetical protein D6767_05460 [Candidatus Hydrogenedentota bacterium]